MKIIPTFVPCLYTFKYDQHQTDEFERVFDEWAEPMFLYNFFEQNEKDIDMPIEEAINKVAKEAKFLRKKLIELAGKTPNQLNQLFKNLYNHETNTQELSRQKAPSRWLRLYAIRIDENIFVITGGTIKLDRGVIAQNNLYRLQDRPHTNDELNKINRCKDYLTDEGVIDNDSFQEIFF
jgi:hypothetical protein